MIRAPAPDPSRCYTAFGGQDDPENARPASGSLRRADAMPGRG
jgi:hypothetical protein